MASAEAAREGGGGGGNGGSSEKRGGNGVSDPADPAETAAAEQQKDRAAHVHPTQTTTSRTLRLFFFLPNPKNEEKRVRDRPHTDSEKSLLMSSKLLQKQSPVSVIVSSQG